MQILLIVYGRHSNKTILFIYSTVKIITVIVKKKILKTDIVAYT